VAFGRDYSYAQMTGPQSSGKGRSGVFDGRFGWVAM
jgi:hypothetical protein